MESKNLTLQSTEQNIREAEKILALLDDIEALRKKDPTKVDMAAVERATGGLTRAELQTMLLELRMRRASFLRGEQPSSAVQNDDVVALKTEVARLQGMMQMSAAGAANHAAPQSQNLPAANAIDGFKGGDNAIILEGVYTGLSDELEKVKESLRQELQYAYQQELAIYNDLTQQISALGAMDPAVLAEKITEVSQLKATDIKVLEDKLSRVGEVDYDLLAEKVAAKMGAAALPAPAGGDEVSALKAELAEMKGMLGAMMTNTQRESDAEFHLLDYEIAEYLSTENATALADLMTEARDLIGKAQRYADNGNDMRAGQVTDGVKARLATVTVCGSEKLTVVAKHAQENAVPLTVSAQKLLGLADVFHAYESQSILPDDEKTGEVVLAKKDVLKDPDLTVFDKQTVVEMGEVGTFTSAFEIDDLSAQKLRTLKQELLTVPLSVLIDVKTQVGGAVRKDVTEQLLAEIKDLKRQVEKGAIAREPLPQVGGSYDELSALTEELNDIVRGAGVTVPAASAKPKAASKKVFRPAVSGKDSKVEKKEQPLAIRRNKVKLSKDDNPDSLANQLVTKVAQNVAKTRIK